MQGQPSLEGEWSGTIPFNNIEAIHTTMLPTGKVMFWQTWTDGTALWDPVTGEFSAMASPSVNIFCSGHAWLPDGKLLVVGGHSARVYRCPLEVETEAQPHRARGLYRRYSAERLAADVLFDYDGAKHWTTPSSR